jgi:inorganic triphosphatase YgiF
MTEFELKFCVPPAALPSLRAALLARGAQRLRLRAHCFDTPCSALARHRIALRLRLEGRHWVQTLKAVGTSTVQRLEHEVPVPGPAGQRPVLDLQRHAGTAAGAALAAALQTAPGAALEERHATDVQRLHCLMVTEGGCQVEAALDVGQTLAGGLREHFVELELEHKGGPLQGLFDLATACVKHGGLWQSTVTKAERGERLRHAALQAAGEAASGAAQPQLPAVSRRAQPQALEQALEKALESLLVSASALAASGVDDALVKQPAFQTALLALQALAHGRHAAP